MVLTVWKVKSGKKSKPAREKKEKAKTVNSDHKGSILKRFVDWLLE